MIVMRACSSSGVMSTPASASHVHVPRFRWWPAIVILFVGTLACTVLWASTEDNRSAQSFWAYIAVIGTFLLLGGWWTFFSQLAWRTIGWGWAAVAVGLVIVGALVRVDGFTGETFPILAFRWQETPQQKAERFQKSTAAGASPVAVSEATDADWPRFRGPHGDGVILDFTLRTDWSKRPAKELWRHPVGAGWSSFSVVGSRAFTMEQRGEDEAVVCYDFESGREVWVCRYPAHYFQEPAGEGPRATPTFFEGEVFSLGATGILTRINASTGELVWKKDTIKDAGAVPLEWGNSASVLVYRDQRGEGPYIVTNPGGLKGTSVVAYGPKPWRSGSAPAGYATPMLVTLAGRQQIVVYDGYGLAGYEPTTGKSLWRFPWQNFALNNCAQPIQISENRLFASSGYSLGSVLLEFGSDLKPKLVWNEPTNLMRCKFNSPVMHDGHIYGLDEGLLACLDLRTSKRLWKKGRYGFGQLLLVGNTLVIQSEDGVIHIVKATPQGPEAIAKWPALSGRAWNEPLICRGRLLVRNNAEAVCYDLE